MFEHPLKNAYIGEYIPTSWLLAYRPLQEDLNDVSWNWKNASWLSWTGSFSTLWNYVGARFTRNSSWVPTQYVVTSLQVDTLPITIFGWGAFSAITNIQNRTWLFNSSSSNTWFLLGFRGGDGNRTYFKVGDGGNFKVAEAPTLNTWYFYTATITNSEVKFYINWTLNTTQSISNPTISNGVFRLWVGSYDNSRYGGTDGYVRHFGVYNRVLSADEVMKIYNFTK